MSDVVVRGEVQGIRRSVELWIGCVAGALEESDYREKLSKAGYESIDVEATRIYRTEDARGFLDREGIDAKAIATVASTWRVCPVSQPTTRTCWKLDNLAARLEAAIQSG